MGIVRSTKHLPVGTLLINVLDRSDRIEIGWVCGDKGVSQWFYIWDTGDPQPLETWFEIRSDVIENPIVDYRLHADHPVSVQLQAFLASHALGAGDFSLLEPVASAIVTMVTEDAFDASNDI